MQVYQGDISSRSSHHDKEPIFTQAVLLQASNICLQLLCSEVEAENEEGYVVRKQLTY